MKIKNKLLLAAVLGLFSCANVRGMQGQKDQSITDEYQKQMKLKIIILAAHKDASSTINAYLSKHPFLSTVEKVVNNGQFASDCQEIQKQTRRQEILIQQFEHSQRPVSDAIIQKVMGKVTNFLDKK